MLLLCVRTLSPLGSSSALLFWYGIPQAASHEECLPIKVVSVTRHFLPGCFATVIVHFSCLNRCFFHNKALGGLFFFLCMDVTALLEVYTANNEIFPVMVTGSSLSYVFVKRTRCFVFSCPALVNSALCLISPRCAVMTASKRLSRPRC